MARRRLQRIGSQVLFSLFLTAGQQQLVFEFVAATPSGAQTLRVTSPSVSSWLATAQTYALNLTVVVAPGALGMYANGTLLHHEELAAPLTISQQGADLAVGPLAAGGAAASALAVVFFDAPLTESEVTPSNSFGLTLGPECRCPPSHPRWRPQSQSLCYTYNLTASTPRIYTQPGSNVFFPGYMTDAAPAATRWQSPNTVKPVTLTFDLQGRHEVTLVIFTFFSPRPTHMLLEASADGGATFAPRQYYARDCSAAFGMPDDGALAAFTSVNCITNYSRAFVVSGGDVVYNLLHASRPGAATFNANPAARAFATATHLRATLYEPFINTPINSGIGLARFFAVSNIEIEGRCACNGHAAACTPATASTLTATCACSHNTTGSK